MSLSSLTGAEARARCRDGTLSGPTAGISAGYAQFNMAVVPAPFAADFRAFCQDNAQYCPLAEAVPVGSRSPQGLATGADLARDLPAYRVFDATGQHSTVSSVDHLWTDELAAFLIGCSFTFEAALIHAGIGMRHVDAGRNVPMYRTSFKAQAVGPFSCDLVVSMRPIPAAQVAQATAITSRFIKHHGAPVGTQPDALGIANIHRPDFGDPPVMLKGDVPVFWACAVTATCALQAAGLPLAIAHEPGHMFISDHRPPTSGRPGHVVV